MRRDTDVSSESASHMSEPSERYRLAEETEQIRRRSRVVRHHADDLAEQLARIQREVQRTLDELHHDVPRHRDS